MRAGYGRFFTVMIWILSIFASASPVLGASPYFLIWHEVDANIVDGKSSYDDVTFCHLYCDITNAATKRGGSLTITDLSASFGTWAEFSNNKSAAARIAGETKKFKLLYDGSEEGLLPVGDEGVKLIFWGDADKGFSDKHFSFAIDGSTTAKGTLPTIRSTTEQMKSFVPYIELVVDVLDRVTDVKWRFVDPANADVALVKRTKAGGANVGRVIRLTFLDANGKRISISRVRKNFTDGEELSGIAKLEKAVMLSELNQVRILFEEDNQKPKCLVNYEWHFYIK